MVIIPCHDGIEIHIMDIIKQDLSQAMVARLFHTIPHSNDNETARLLRSYILRYYNLRHDVKR